MSDSDKTYCEAEAILKRLAEKLVEPMNSDVDGSKTMDEWRKEVAAIHTDVIEFEMRRRRER